METLTQTLADSITYQDHEKQLKKASALLELSKMAYQRQQEWIIRSEKEKSILLSDSWRMHPFVTIASQERAEHKAVISEMACKRLLKAYKRILFKLFLSSKLQKAI